MLFRSLTRVSAGTSTPRCVSGKYHGPCDDPGTSPGEHASLIIARTRYIIYIRTRSNGRGKKTHIPPPRPFLYGKTRAGHITFDSNTILLKIILSLPISYQGRSGMGGIHGHARRFIHSRSRLPRPYASGTVRISGTEWSLACGTFWRQARSASTMSRSSEVSPGVRIRLR